MDDFYKCRSCGSNEFTHDVSVLYEEVFDSKEKTVVERKRYNVGTVWCCKKCNANIPSNDVNKFISRMCDASFPLNEVDE